ncbi:MAG TPA: preprotein translocase subunit SecA [Myxococcota bacterium]|nr:preprotein translocase subunit SecA [Myxococcota bacterium]
MFGAVDSVIKKVFGSANDRVLKKMHPDVVRINEFESAMQARSDEELAAMTAGFKQRVENGETLESLLHEVFACVREVSVRVLGLRHYDVQMLGGIVLHQGKVAEMKTGEGKTLCATLPLYLNALTGNSGHLITVNDYLARRDAEWMGGIYGFLGMSTGSILSGERNDRIKRDAYACDITYGTNNEFGFDYLRDNMKFRAEDYTQRGHHFGIVDEVDSILIDEARTPLIISGPTNDSVDKYYVIDQVVPLLQDELDYLVDEKGRSVHLTDAGVDKVEKKLGIDNLYDPHNMEILHHVNQALKAHTVFKRDKDYVVREGKVVIVDEHTGRLMHGRRWSDGLHQAVEAKEKLRIENESQTYATITFQNLFRMYDRLAGMTGTAETEAPELANIYDLEVVVVPTNVPIIRDDEDDIVYRTQEEKFDMVLKDIVECNGRGQPVLVGTTSVEKSELVSRMLKRRSIAHQTLNAKQHAREGHVVAQAGRLGGVTISTNMAGRGTDIKLGGNPEELAKDLDDPGNSEGYEQRLEVLQVECATERDKVLEAGGLRIIGTERHESRRIDNQLRGRSGRQGDPGSSKFYLSLEDDLLRIFGTDKMMAFMDKMGMRDEEPIEHPWISKSIENAQKKVEGHHFNIRKNLLEYDDVLNQQRKLVYDLRRRILTGDTAELREITLEAFEGVVEDILDDHVQEGVHPEEWDIKGLREKCLATFAYQWEGDDDGIRDFAHTELRERLLEVGTAAYEAKEKELGQSCHQIERMLLLQFVDQLWKDHLLAMDRLRDGIGLRGYGQRNPLLEYKKEGFSMFMMMTALRDESVVSRLLRVQLTTEAEQAASRGDKRTARQVASGALEQKAVPRGPAIPPGLSREQADAAAKAAAPTAPQARKRPEAGEEARLFASQAGLRRNDPCPCGSGKKHKNCCYKAGWKPPALVEPSAAQ